MPSLGAQLAWLAHCPLHALIPIDLLHASDRGEGQNQERNCHDFEILRILRLFAGDSSLDVEGFRCRGFGTGGSSELAVCKACIRSSGYSLPKRPGKCLQSPVSLFCMKSS